MNSDRMPEATGITSVEWTVLTRSQSEFPVEPAVVPRRVSSDPTMLSEPTSCASELKMSKHRSAPLSMRRQIQPLMSSATLNTEACAGIGSTKSVTSITSGRTVMARLARDRMAGSRGTSHSLAASLFFPIWVQSFPA